MKGYCLQQNTPQFQQVPLHFAETELTVSAEVDEEHAHIMVVCKNGWNRQ